MALDGKVIWVHFSSGYQVDGSSSKTGACL